MKRACVSPHMAVGLGLIAIVGVAVSGCGPVEYISGVTRKASSEVSAAEAAEADKYAPYHYTRAVQYLDKAREEASRADFQAANRFGRIAYEDAAAARELAQKRAKTGEIPGPLEDAPTAPTKKPAGGDAIDHADGPIEDAPEAGGK